MSKNLRNIPLYHIAKIAPKNASVWIFGAIEGNGYADNAKYLFEWINANTDIKAVWVTRNKEIYKKLKNLGFKVCKSYSLKAIYYGLIAKVCVTTHINTTTTMKFLNNPKTLLVQLWHGAPLKKIGSDSTLDGGKAEFKNIFEKFFCPFLTEKYDLVTAISNEDKSKFHSAFNHFCSHVTEQNIKITGYARNDILINKNPKDSFNVIYMPTFRNYGKDDVKTLFEKFNPIKFDKILGENNINLIIKVHPFNEPNSDIKSELENCKNIKFANQNDANEILCQANILITDYSSCYFDFLLTERPIIFAPFDLGEYKQKYRELYYDYNDITPGPKCETWDEVIEWVVKFKNNSNPYLQERKILKNKFHIYQDANSCERIYNEIIKLIN